MVLMSVHLSAYAALDATVFGATVFIRPDANIARRHLIVNLIYAISTAITGHLGANRLRNLLVEFTRSLDWVVHGASFLLYE